MFAIFLGVSIMRLCVGSLKAIEPLELWWLYLSTGSINGNSSQSRVLLERRNE
jgi:hypothetical protein